MEGRTYGVGGVRALVLHVIHFLGAGVAHLSRRVGAQNERGIVQAAGRTSRTHHNQHNSTPPTHRPTMPGMSTGARRPGRSSSALNLSVSSHCASASFEGSTSGKRLWSQAQSGEGSPVGVCVLWWNVCTWA